jgi:hypothetical protein
MPTTTFNIASAADINTAVASINSGGANAAVNATYTFNLTGSFTLDRNLAAINLVAVLDENRTACASGHPAATGERLTLPPCRFVDQWSSGDRPCQP